MLRSDDGEVIFTYPTQGTPSEWRLRRRQVDEWQEAYPGLDVLDECRRARVWLLANHPKTARGMCRFLVAWFNRSVDRGGGSRRTLPAREPIRYEDNWFEECGRLHNHQCGGRLKHDMQCVLDAGRVKA